MDGEVSKSSVTDADVGGEVESPRSYTEDGTTEDGDFTSPPGKGYMALGEMFPRSPYRKPEDTSNNYGSITKDWKMSLSRSPVHDDANKYRLEANQLRLQVKQLNMDLQSEQDTVSQVRRRLNTVEKERLDAATRANAEIADLESQNAKLRAQLEKGEATRQNLEFELTKTQRDVNHQRQSTLEKESLLADTKEKLQDKIHELTDQVRHLEHKVDMQKSSSDEVDKKYKRKLEEREHELAKSHTEIEITKAERDKLDSLVIKHESAISEFTDKLQEMESDKKNQTENLRRTLTEIEYAKEREDRLKKDLEMSLQRLRSVEESIEAERAAHLETKFNSEIIQLRVRDLEGALDVEKSANDEANKAIDRLTKQIRQLESSYEEERRNGKDVSTKLEKVEKEYSSVRRQLTSEVENKKNVIGNLSKELEVHQKNFNELKEELTKAKKRQIYLEETYGGSMRELELLLDNFQVEDRVRRTSLKGKRDTGKAPVPSTVLESLRHTLTEYKKRLDDTTEELSKMKKSCDSLHKEVDQCKEMIWAKDKALEDAQKNYTRTAKELNRIRSEYAGLESSMTKLRMNLQSSSTNSTKDRKRVHELSEEIMKLVKRHKADDEEKMAFLHGMYQRLLAGRVMASPKDTGGLNQFTWADLTSLVYEHMCNLITVSQRAGEKIKHLEDAVKSKEDVIDDMQKAHESQLNKLTALTKEREISWHKQKEEIEAHYSQLLSEIQSRSKKSQAMADQAWDKIRMTGSVQQGLETECSDLRTQMLDVQKQNKALLATCSLLSGALYPTFSRSNLLSLQRHMLEDQMNNWEFCRERMELLVSTLGSEMKAAQEQSENQPSKLEKMRKRHPILTFRIGAVAVLAANRLRYFGQSSNRMFVTYDTAVSNQSGIVVCAGGVKPNRKQFPATQEDTDSQSEREQYASMVQWLSSSELLNVALTSTSELMEVLEHMKDKSKASPVESRALVNAARNSFTKFLDKLSRQFESVNVHPNLAHRDRNSLVRMIGRGLSKICMGKTLDQKRQVAPIQELLGALQNHILDFTQRLHSVEVERRNLLLELDKLRAECDDLPQREEIVKLHEELDAIRSKDLQYVSMDKFESVCQELNNALRREQQAQHLLIEQSRQLEEITLRLDLYTTEGMEKEQTLTEAVHGLTETKMELKRKEQTLRQLNRQVISVEGEKKSLQNNVMDAEKALRTAARDKEILAQYVKAVEGALEQVRKELSLSKGLGGRDRTLSKYLLNTDFIPSDVGKAGPELLACQNLVRAFVDAQNQSYSKINALEEEIYSHKEHVNTLKRELSDAVRREYEEQPEIPTRDGHRTNGNDTGRDIDMTQSESFMPIKEDSEISFAAPKPATPKSRQYESSPKKSDRSPKFQTPSKSYRSHNIRPKAFEPHGR